jgi:omega-amidase
VCGTVCSGYPDSMQVAALQFDVQRAATDTRAHLANLAAARAAVLAAAEGGARIAVLPELWSTSFPSADAGADQLLADAAEEAAVCAKSWAVEFGIVLAGSFLAPADGLGRAGAGRFFNRLLIHDGPAGGEVVLAYDKVHLFSPTAEHEVFAAGNDLPGVVDCSAGRISGAICYDLRFPELFLPMRHAEADLVVVPAQWAGARATHWKALVLGRAVEGQFTVIASNRTGEEPLGQRGRTVAFPGNSLVVSATGEVLGEGEGECGAIFGLLDPDLAKKQRVRVPVGKDRREELYAKWKKSPP